MNLARHSISATNPIQIFDAKFDSDCDIFTAATPAGFAVYRTYPFQLIRKRELKGGTLAAVLPLHSSNILFLLGGGRSPLYPPNKVILWNDALGKDVGELEFREKVRGMACRRGWLAVCLRRRVVVFRISSTVTRYGEWDTFDNPRGLLAIATAPHSTLLAIAGRQNGHVQLIHLPPCPPTVLSGPPPSSPPKKPPPQPLNHPVSIIAAHSNALNTLSVTSSGKLLATTSVRGTIIRIWDSATGRPLREFRRGTDKAIIYGVAFRPDEQELCVWSDKGTVHIFALTEANQQSAIASLAPYLPLPKFFGSEWSYAKYRIPVQSSHISLSSASKSPAADLPEEERCTVGWINVASESSSKKDYQLVVLTFAGGWYRLSLPNVAGISHHASSSQSQTNIFPVKPKPSYSSYADSIDGSSVTARPDKGKRKEDKPEVERKGGRNCTLEEYRRFGRWDGWG